jgi:hypothetical protein
MSRYVCPNCGGPKILKWGVMVCIPCKNAYSRKWNKEHPEAHNASTDCKQFYIDLRAAAVIALGGTCRNCGKTERLDVHHKNWDGRLERENGVSWFDNCKWILENVSQASARFELLCRKCHFARHRIKRRFAKTWV